MSRLLARFYKMACQNYVVLALGPAVLLAGLAVAIFATTLFFNYRTFYVFPDNIDQFFAWYQKLAYAIHQGNLPLWDANVSAGHSFVGELQSGVFYPVNLAWVWLFGSGQGISIFWLELIVVFHFWLASLGMYYASRAFGITKLAALAAGLTYAYAGTVAVRSVSQTAIFFGVCYIPWVFWAFYQFLKTSQKRFLILCGLGQGLIILAGHVQPWFHAVMLIGLFSIFRVCRPAFEAPLRSLIKGLLAVAVSVGIALVVAAPQLWLSAEYLPQAYRFVGDAQPIGAEDRVSFTTFTKKFSYPPEGLLSLINPVKYPVVDGNELYIGLIGLAIVLLALVVSRYQLQNHPVWRQNKVFLIGTSLLTGIIMLGYWTFLPALMRLLPLVSQVRQLARYSVLVHFCLSIMVGIGIEVVAAKSTNLGRRQRLIWAGITSLVALNSIYIFLLTRTGLIDKHFAYQSLILALCLGLVVIWRRYTKFILWAGVSLSMAAQVTWFLPKVRDFPNTYAPTYYRRTASIDFLEKFYGQSRVLLEDNALPVNIGDVYNIQTVNGYGATLHKNFLDYLNEPETDATKGLHMDLLNVQFLVSKKTHPELIKRLYDHDRKIYVYERPQFVPRAYYASQAQPCRQHLSSCEKPQILHYSDGMISLKTSSTVPQKLVLVEVYYPGWQATVDGQPAKIEPFSLTKTPLFRSVQVPAGQHTITFKYR